MKGDGIMMNKKALILGVFILFGIIGLLKDVEAQSWNTPLANGFFGKSGDTNVTLNISAPASTVANLSQVVFYYRMNNTGNWMLITNQTNSSTPQASFQTSFNPSNGTFPELSASYEFNASLYQNTSNKFVVSGSSDVSITGLTTDKTNPTGLTQLLRATGKTRGLLEVDCSTSSDNFDTTLTYQSILFKPSGTRVASSVVANASSTSKGVINFDDGDTDETGTYTVFCTVLDNLGNAGSSANSTVFLSNQDDKAEQVAVAQKQSEISATLKKVVQNKGFITVVVVLLGGYLLLGRTKGKKKG